MLCLSDLDKYKLDAISKFTCTFSTQIIIYVSNCILEIRHCIFMKSSTKFPLIIVLYPI